MSTTSMTSLTTRQATQMACQMVREIVKNDEFVQLIDDIVSKAMDKRLADINQQLHSLQITLREIQTEKNQLVNEVQQLKKVIEGKDERICVLEGKVHDIQCENEKQSSSSESLSRKLERQENHISALEQSEEQMQQYSRRNCIRIFGIREEQAENTDDIVCRLAREKLEVNIKKEDIDRSHRVGRKSTTKPRGIIVKLVSYRTRQEIMSKRRKLKNTGLSIHEELTKKNQKLLEETKNHSKTHNAWSKDGRIIALIDASNGGTITKLITCTEDLKKL